LKRRKQKKEKASGAADKNESVIGKCGIPTFFLIVVRIFSVSLSPTNWI
jgi:hypothetical protein